MERLPLISVELIQAHILNLMKNIIHMTLINSVCKTDSKIWLQISSEAYYDDDDYLAEQANAPRVLKSIIILPEFFYITPAFLLQNNFLTEWVYGGRGEE